MSGEVTSQSADGTMKQSKTQGMIRASGVYQGGHLFVTGEQELMITEGEGQVCTGSARKIGFVLQWRNMIVDLDEEIDEHGDGSYHIALSKRGPGLCILVKPENAWSYDERQDMIYLGHTTVLDGRPRFVTNLQFPIRSYLTQLESLMDSLGVFSVRGLRFKPESKLNFSITPGEGFLRAGRYVSGEIDPNRVVWGEQLRAPFTTYVHRDGEGGWDAQVYYEPAIRPAMWDDGSGELKPVPENRYTLQQIYLEVETGLVIIQYGQELLSNRDKVANALVFAEWEPYDQPGLVRRAVVAVKGGAVTLKDKRKCIITHCNRFGGLGGE